MRKPEVWFVVFIIGFGVFCLFAAMDRDHPHRFVDKCTMCHLGTADPAMLVGDVGRLCGRCHMDRNSRSHPAGFVPGMALPEGFPLSKGKMTCVTCHFPHPSMVSDSVDAMAAETNPFMLRFEETGKRFCLTCHAPDHFSKESGAHGTALGVAHLKSPDPGVLELLDQSSRDCLACHDGTVSANVEMGGASWNHARGIGLSHPIGTNYADAVRKRPRQYHRVDALPQELSLVNGRVECVTCHDHYSRQKNLLVMDNYGSRLCLSCHNL